MDRYPCRKMALASSTVELSMRLASNGDNCTSSVLFLAILSVLMFGTLAGFSGTSAILGFAGLLLQLRRSNWNIPQIKIVTLAFALGGALESISVHEGLVTYQGTHGYHALPWWMLLAWMAISLQFEGSLRSLRGRPVLAFLMGAMIGPVFVLAGEEMRILGLATPIAGLSWVAFEWGTLFAIFASLSKRYLVR